MAHGNASHRLYVHGGLYLHAAGASGASLGVGVQGFRFGVRGATWTLGDCKRGHKYKNSKCSLNPKP